MTLTELGARIKRKLGGKDSNIRISLVFLKKNPDYWQLIDPQTVQKIQVVLARSSPLNIGVLAPLQSWFADSRALLWQSLSKELENFAALRAVEAQAAVIEVNASFAPLLAEAEWERQLAVLHNATAAGLSIEDAKEVAAIRAKNAAELFHLTETKRIEFEFWKKADRYKRRRDKENARQSYGKADSRPRVENADADPNLERDDGESSAEYTQ